MEHSSILNTIRKLNENIHQYEFFHIVRVLENEIQSKAGLGISFRLDDEIIKFKQNPTLKNSMSDTLRCRFNIRENKIELVTNFLGLIGSNGVMPYFLTEHIQQQLREKNLSLLEFLNIFYHRMLSFLYRAWSECNQLVSYEQGKYRDISTDKIPRYIHSTVGEYIQNDGSLKILHQNFKLYYAPHFISKERTSEKLCSIVKDYFCVNASVEEFVSQMIEIPEERKLHFSKYCKYKIGYNTYIGDKTWNCVMKIKLIIGPMELEEFNWLLPDKTGYRMLKNISLLCVPTELICDLQLILKGKDVPFIFGETKVQLGYNTWLISKQPKKNLSCTIATFN
jgi:type VI secretion system protein ImpH